MTEKIKEEIIKWNNRFPLDRWWRNKHKVSYLSPEHREFSFYSQLFEYNEEVLFNEFKAEREQEKVEEENSYSPDNGNWWKGNSSSEEDVDDWFYS